MGDVTEFGIPTPNQIEHEARWEAWARGEPLSDRHREAIRAGYRHLARHRAIASTVAMADIIWRHGVDAILGERGAA